MSDGASTSTLLFAFVLAYETLNYLVLCFRDFRFIVQALWSGREGRINLAAKRSQNGNDEIALVETEDISRRILASELSFSFHPFPWFVSAVLLALIFSLPALTAPRASGLGFGSDWESMVALRLSAAYALLIPAMTRAHVLALSNMKYGLAAYMALRSTRTRARSRSLPRSSINFPAFPSSSFLSFPFVTSAVLPIVLVVDALVHSSSWWMEAEEKELAQLQLRGLKPVPKRAAPDGRRRSAGGREGAFSTRRAEAVEPPIQLLALGEEGKGGSTSSSILRPNTYGLSEDAEGDWGHAFIHLNAAPYDPAASEEDRTCTTSTGSTASAKKASPRGRAGGKARTGRKR